MYYQGERELSIAVRWLIRISAAAVILAVLSLGAFLGYVFLTDYKPEPVEAAPLGGEPSVGAAAADTPYSVITYNIGYCGLGEEQDFFMEGGKNSGALSLDEVEANLKAVGKTLGGGYDFMLLQEVDADSKRSFGVNQREVFEKQFKDNYMNAFGVNYKTPFVPLPVGSPMGNVLSGLQVFSKVVMESSYRYAFDGEESFPVNLFELDRCFMVMTIPVDNGHNLKLINAHFSAYDKNGENKTKQMAQMKQFLLEQDPNDYIVLGGDWNQLLPGTSKKPEWWKAALPDWVAEIPERFIPEGYKWGADPSQPTCRANNAPYQAGKNYVAAVDGFLVSPNVEIISVKTQALGFVNSDHSPVVMEFMLKG